MKLVIFLLGILNGAIATSTNCFPSSCPGTPSPQVGEYPADTSNNDHIYIGGIFGVHHAGDTFYSCGSTRERGIQNLEAFLWATRTFRSRYPSIFREIEVGAVAFDSCLSVDKTVQQLLNLEMCSVAYGSPVVEPNRLLAFVGPDRSTDALALTNIMKQIRKPMVSHAATSAELSSPDYTYFLRTVPSDSEQVKALVSILHKQGWNHTQLIYTDDAYGQAGREAVEAALEASGKCVVQSIAIAASNPTDDEINSLINKLVAQSKTRAVIMFTYDTIAKSILTAIQESRARGMFSWIGTTAWGDSKDVITGVEDYAEGAITIMPNPLLPSLSSFREFYESLTPDMSEGNPWFKQYWQEKFDCYLPGEAQQDYLFECDLSKQSLQGITLDPYVSYTIKAVDAVLNGIEGARRTQCSGSEKLCSGFINNQNKGDIIKQHVSRVQIPGVIQFDEVTGDSLISRYDILNLRQPGTGGFCTEHCYVNVGYYEKLTGASLFTDAILSYNSQGQPLTEVDSVCSSYPCTQCGQVDTTPALPSTTPSSQSNTDKPDTAGAVSSMDNSLSPPPSKMREDSWVIILIILTGIGIILTIVFEIYLMSKIIGDPFIKHWRTMWLGQLLLLAVFLSYLTLFAYVPTPTKYSCGIIRFGIGCSYAMCFAILLVKLMIILSSKTVGYLKGIYQVLMFIFAWGVQIVVDVEWLILRPPDVIMVNNTGTVEWVCKEEFEDHIQSLVYVMFLIVMCMFLAMKAHGIITNHREGIFIGLVSGFAIPVWLVWVLLGVFNEGWQDPATAFGLFTTATLILFIMYLPKVRQLNSMGVEGIYAEDDGVDYAPSLIQPSILPPGSVIYGGPPSYRSLQKPTGPGSVIYVDGVPGGGLGGGMYSEPLNTITKSAQPADIDPNALFLKHPGSEFNYNTAQSVRSAPGGYILRRNPNLSLAPQHGDIDTNTRVLKMTNDLAGRKAYSEANFNVGREFSTLQYPTHRSNKSGAYSIHSGTLKKPKSLQDLGSL